MLGELRNLLYSPERHARRLPFLRRGAGSRLLPGARFDFRLDSEQFKGQIEIGEGSLVGARLVFETDRGSLRIGSDSFINSGTQLICRESIDIGSEVTIAWGCTIYDHNSHSLDWRDRVEDIRRQRLDLEAGRSMIASKDWGTVKSRPILIGNRVWIGFGVTVLSGVRIGEGAVVGAGSVVREDVPAWTVVAGNPATVLRELPRP